jgi:hypothetical protein
VNSVVKDNEVFCKRCLRELFGQFVWIRPGGLKAPRTAYNWPASGTDCEFLLLNDYVPLETKRGPVWVLPKGQKGATKARHQHPLDRRIQRFDLSQMPTVQCPWCLAPNSIMAPTSDTEELRMALAEDMLRAADA